MLHISRSAQLVQSYKASPLFEYAKPVRSYACELLGPVSQGTRNQKLDAQLGSHRGGIVYIMNTGLPEFPSPSANHVLGRSETAGPEPVLWPLVQTRAKQQLWPGHGAGR